jgi:hypothetical protein
MKLNRLLIIFTVCSVFSASALGQTITKCQDAEGQWHYGNYASQECGNSPITELRESGVTLDVREAPPTVEELEKRRAQEQQRREAQLKREEKRRVDRVLKEKYSSEEVIVSLREQRLGELRKQMAFNESELEKLKNQREALGEPKSEYKQQEAHELTQRIERFERAIERGRLAMEETQEDYRLLIERYREIDAPE